jgi:uncharacterized membrane protein YfcA
MPFVGVIGSTIAMATPAGGGIVYFPVIAMIAVPATQATSYAYATQTVGMGVFGAINWIRKAHHLIIWWVIGVTVVATWVGSALSMFVFPIHNDLVLESMFASFCFLLIVYVIWGLVKGSLPAQDQELPLDWKSVSVCAVTGILGGILLGWIPVGVDVFMFVVLTALYGMDPRRATVISILILGWSSILPFLVHLIWRQTIPMYFWALTLGGCVLGARIGTLLLILIGKRVMLIGFIVILLAEIVRVIILFAILPLFLPITNSTLTNETNVSFTR